MPRQFIDVRTGDVFFRTRLLPLSLAERFARCLAANATRFINVDVIHSDQAKGARMFFVRYSPVNPDRQADAITREQAKRTARALADGDAYQWFLDVDGRRPFYYCLSTSGEVYEVDAGSCNCPDYEFRCSRMAHTGLRCKHIEALLLAYEQGRLTRLQDVYDTPAWRAAHPLSQSAPVASYRAA